MNEEVKTAFAEHCEQVDITDENKDELMLLCARLGMVSRLPAVLQAGANLKCTDGQISIELAMEQKNEAAVEVLLQAIICAGIGIDSRYEGNARDTGTGAASAFGGYGARTGGFGASAGGFGAGTGGGDVWGWRLCPCIWRREPSRSRRR